MRALFIFIGLLLLSEVGAEPPGVLPPAIKTLNLHFTGQQLTQGTFTTIVLPIKRVDRLLIIEARIDSMIGNFILDTGAPDLVLNKTYFRNSWISGDAMASSATNGVTSVLRTWVNELELKELKVEKIKANLTELGHIENRSGIRILGLLGVGIFKSCVITLDLHKNILILQQPDKNGNVAEVDDLKLGTPLMQMPFKLSQNAILLGGSIAGKKLTFCLDTGAETNVLSSGLPRKVLSMFEVSKRMVLLGTGGSKIEVLIGRVSELTIGTMTFKNMGAVISNLEGLSEATDIPLDGMIGYDFLIKGIVSINFVKKELCLYPFEESKP